MTRIDSAPFYPIEWGSKTYVDHPKVDGVTLDLYPWRQTDSESCGVAVGATVINTIFYDRNPDHFFHDFVKACKVSPVLGVTENMLISSLAYYDVHVSKHEEMKLADIMKAIDEGCPIISTRDWPADENCLHWMIIYGYASYEAYGREMYKIYVYCPFWGNGMAILERNFYDIWTPKGYGLVCWGEC